MPKHAFNRSIRTRLRSTRGVVVVGTFAALSCAAVSGTAQAASAPPAAPAAPASAGTTAQSAATTTYTVKSGDYLVKIAASNKTPGGWQAIASANKISSPYIIYPGQVLKLPTGTSSSASQASSTAAKASTTQSSAATAVPASATTPVTPAPSGQTYTNDLDGWIKHSLAIMAQHGIPGSYDGIHRNIMRESSGNPNAINLWDSNAAAGHPSIGLLQVIQPTFNAYHVPGTSMSLYDPVANITAACNYAFHVYGSIDNVNGPY